MGNTIDMDDGTVTHMLGYLTVEQWADAIRNHSVDESKAMRLLAIQDEQYGGHVKSDVEEELKGASE